MNAVTSTRIQISTLSVALGVLLASQALWAETFSVTGQMRIKPPSAATNRSLTLGNSVEPGATLNQTGSAPRTITMPASIWRLQGEVFRVFPNFAGVAQLSSDYSTTHGTKTLRVGSGPGTVNWCPQITGCVSFTQGTVAPLLISIRPGENNYGGTFELVRNAVGSFVLLGDPPPPPVSASVFPFTRTLPWTAGLTKFRTLKSQAAAPKIYQSPSLGPDGSLLTVGTFVSTADAPAPLNITGFPMGTGTIFVIDATPPTEDGGPFSSTTTGDDNRTADGNGNIVLVGGGVAYGGSTGNNFFRVNRLTMELPEPAGAAGLLAGSTALLGLWRKRERCG